MADDWSYDETTMFQMNELGAPMADSGHNTHRRSGAHAPLAAGLSVRIRVQQGSGAEHVPAVEENASEERRHTESVIMAALAQSGLAAGAGTMWKNTEVSSIQWLVWTAAPMNSIRNDHAR